ncbi:MAG: hypothetical protein PHG63_03940, partial [Candidatus Dojkabacteria bacterium]|nr:hypothetical protein [Candidatus Dojkabacteria bacterium]
MLETVKGILSPGVIAAFAGVVYGGGFFLFWRSLVRTRHTTGVVPGEGTNWGAGTVSSHSFDLLAASTVSAVIVGRIAYIVSTFHDFIGLRWFWLPYERIEGEVHIADSLPWAAFRLWDGGILIEGALLGFLAVLLVQTYRKADIWKRVLNASSDMLWLWLTALLIYWYIETSQLVLLASSVGIVFLGVVRLLSNMRKKGGAAMAGSISSLWYLVNLTGIPFALGIRQEVWNSTGGDLISAACVVGSLLIAVWCVLMTCFEKRPDWSAGLQEVNGTDGESGGVEPLRPTAVPSVGWRRFARVPRGPSQEGVRNGGAKREGRRYFMSYKDFSKEWSGTLGLLKNRISQRSRRQ